jgi:capsular polysaccharide biosynthesis protein
MLLKGMGIKAGITRAFTKAVKTVFPAGSIYNAPATIITSAEWIMRKGRASDKMTEVYAEEWREECAPEICNYKVSERFKRDYRRKVPAAYVAEINGGMTFGKEANFIITPDHLLLADLSREFGQYGGKPMHDSSLITQKLKLPPSVSIKGRIAVLSTCGSNNFHHWNYDIIPRVHLLKQAGVFNTIDHFIISWSGIPFQKESLKILGIPEDRIINPVEMASGLLKADVLIVPSLPSPLGTVSPWVVDFLRRTYNPESKVQRTFPRIYLSRKKVTTRKILNNDAFSQLLKQHSIKEIFPEDYTVSELATILAGAEFIISVHGSGLSNLCFISDKTTVIDILAPYHQDGYYWMISNIRNSKYIGFFGEGEHPPDDLDLVRKKIDNDIYLNIDTMSKLLSREAAL